MITMFMLGGFAALLFVLGAVGMAALEYGLSRAARELDKYAVLCQRADDVERKIGG